MLVGFDKSRMDFRAVSKGSSNEAIIKLTGKQLAKLKLSEISSTHPDMLKAVEIKTEDGARALKVTYKAGDKVEFFRAKITAKTNIPKVPELTLAVSARVSEDINAMPASLWFTEAGAKNNKRPGMKTGTRPRTFSVTSLSKQAFKITKVEDPTGAVEAKASSTAKGWVVRATMKKQPEKKMGKLIVHTDSKKQPTLEISYRIRSRGPTRGRGPNRMLPGIPGMRKPGPGKSGFRIDSKRPGRIPTKAMPRRPGKGLRIKPVAPTKVQPKPASK